MARRKLRKGSIAAKVHMARLRAMRRGGGAEQAGAYAEAASKGLDILEKLAPYAKQQLGIHEIPPEFRGGPRYRNVGGRWINARTGIDQDQDPEHFEWLERTGGGIVRRMKGGRLQKGSRAAKMFMARLRAMRKGGSPVG